MRKSIPSIAVILLAACGGSSKTGVTTVTQTVVTQTVSKSSGGTVTVASGTTLAIPANSLSADTTITAAVAAPATTLPNPTTLQGSYYEFGPNGTTFNPPASLTLPNAGTPPSGSTAVISYYDSSAGKWVDLTTTSSGSSLTAQVSHFTGFIVRWVITVAGLNLDCNSVKRPCGGNLVGTWGLAAICPAQGSSSSFSGCPDSSLLVGLTVAGTATFSSSNNYGFNFTGTASYTLDATASCMSQHSITSCAQLQAALRSTSSDIASATCSSASGGGCHCTGVGTQKTIINQSGSYTTSGNNITVTPQGGAAETDGYCVDGTNLWVHSNATSSTINDFGFVKQ